MLFLRYKDNITTIKYSLIMINIFFMIFAIRALVNNQTIVESINQVKEETHQTEERTHYVKNFLTPYLQSDFAPYFFAHENNQIFPWERIIRIITLQDEELPGLEEFADPDSISIWTTGSEGIGEHYGEQWKIYVTTIISTIRIGRIWIPFIIK